jgi:hypothetical protein
MVVLSHLFILEQEEHPLNHRRAGPRMGNNKLSHRLPLPPLTICNSSPFSHSNSAATSPSMSRVQEGRRIQQALARSGKRESCWVEALLGMSMSGLTCIYPKTKFLDPHVTDKCITLNRSSKIPGCLSLNLDLGNVSSYF